MMHRFGSNRLSEAKAAELEETDQGSRGADFITSGRTSLSKNFNVDRVKRQIQRNFDNFKMLLSLERQDTHQHAAKLLDKLTQDLQAF